MLHHPPEITQVFRVRHLDKRNSNGKNGTQLIKMTNIASIFVVVFWRICKFSQLISLFLVWKTLQGYIWHIP